MKMSLRMSVLFAGFPLVLWLDGMVPGHQGGSALFMSYAFGALFATIAWNAIR